LVGNPNCGKTTLFNALTGARQDVGNWPGVTVERKVGRYRSGDRVVTVVDLPGVYSLGVASDSALDERIARDYITGGEADLIVNIVDAANLERNLYLTAQLVEMRVPMVLVLNMMDVARERRIRIDLAALEQALGCPVLGVVAHRGEGLDALRRVIDHAACDRTLPRAATVFAPEVERAIAAIVTEVDAVAAARRLEARWLAVKLLENDVGAAAWASPAAVALAGLWQRRITEQAGDDADILIADGRYGFANALLQGAVQRLGDVPRTTTDRIDRIVLHRLFGIPIFLAVMYGLFLFTINVGSAFIDFFAGLAGTLFVDTPAALLGWLSAPEWLIALVAGGVGSGIQTVATFIPVIACLYLFLSFLEDCGYMARAAFVMDRMMRAVGLPGKSFIPLIVGFGCNVPAIMATRTLESRRDRIITVMMAPFMSCGARLPVYALFTAAFFPSGGQNVVFALYLIGIVFAVGTGLVLRRTLLQGEASPFVMELPPYHLPTLRGIALRTWDRLQSFVVRAGRVIVACVVVLNMLGAVGTDGSFGNENTDRSVLAGIGRALTPVFEPMGIDADNWPATVGLFTGIFAKEAVVGTLNALYGALAEAERDSGAAEDAKPAFDPIAGIKAALETIPANLAGLADALTDPLGIAITAAPSLEVAAAEQDVDLGTYAAMAARFDGTHGAFAYLLAVLLYMPCVSAVAAIWRETGPRWAVFSVLWTSALAYGSAVLAYQTATLGEDPRTAVAWIGGIVLAFAAAVIALRRAGGRGVSAHAPAAAE
jgi:ferrous iron transport protein B